MKKQDIEWSEKIRDYIETQVRTMEFKELVKKNAENQARPVSQTDSTPLIREDRER